MKRLALLLGLLSSLGWGQTLTSITPTTVMLPGNAGTYAPATYTMMQWDSTTATRGAYIYAYYTHVGTGYNSSIYSNSVFRLRYHPGATTDSLQQISLHLTANQNASSPYTTRKLAGYYAAPTPWDRHPYFAVHGGQLLLAHGLHGSGGIRDTIYIDAATQIDAGTETFTSTNALTPWITKDAIRIQNAAGLPTGLSAGTDYHMIRDGANTFRFATSVDNAIAGTAINITAVGTGTDTVIRSTSAAWYPSDTWTMDLSTGVYTQRHLTPSTGWFRGYTYGGATAAIWHDYLQKYLFHSGKAFPASEQYSWFYDPSDHSTAAQSSGGNERPEGSGTAPTVWSAQSMTYDPTRRAAWFFGDQDTIHTGTFEGAGNSLWRKDTTAAWSEVSPVTPRPRMRKQHCVVYIPGEDKIMVAGGLSSTSQQLVDIWLYNIGANTWDSLTTATFSSGAAHTYCAYDTENNGVIFLQSTDNDWWFMGIGTDDAAAGGSGRKSLLGIGPR
jgi:hypothetical protein